MKSTNTQDAPRRSRSQSRSRADQVAPHSDTCAPPVPLIPSPSTRQQKPFPIPAVIPPGYPEDTRWTVGLSGRPRLETPDQFRMRYGVLPPAVAPVREQPQKVHSSQPPPPHEPQTSFTQESPTGSAQPPTTRKPFLKRFFGGMIGHHKDVHSAISAEPPSATHMLTVSHLPVRGKQRSRTKSVC
ncbi:hypothetical protein DL96DRAFT_997044 [Flagelloscypha sp. PMI_526]|nr:hypothetical protein DL96DRAFT_997044 [Flagelloscypha sp. PMI_526]